MKLPLVASIALRNLFLHRSKTILIGTIMTLGIMVMFVGNSLIDTAIGGLTRMFVDGYTGDLMVTGPTTFPVTIFGETAGGEDVVPHIAKFDEYRAFLGARADVAATMPMLTGRVDMGLGETLIGQGSMFGVDIAEYRNFFSGNVSIVEGSWPDAANGADPWILLSRVSQAMLSRAAGTPIGPGSRITLSALGESAGTVIREVEVKGIVEFAQGDSTLARISLCDADTMRDLLGFASLRDGAVILTAQEASFVASFDPDALFAEDAPADGASPAASGTAAPVTAGDDLAPAAGAIPRAAPAWQFLLVKTARRSDAPLVMRALRAETTRLGQSDRVQDWVDGAGSTARTAKMVSLVFDLMVGIVAVVVVIITMNALVVSVGERIPEIGTLRAIGAKKAFVRRMVLLETAFLTMISGAAGLSIGAIIMIALGKSGIKAPNLFFEALFGGAVLMPRMSLAAAAKAFAWILGMSLASSLYPIAVALRIKPVVAMQGE